MGIGIHDERMAIAFFGAIVAISGAFAHGVLIFVPWFRRRALLAQALLVPSAAGLLWPALFFWSSEPTVEWLMLLLWISVPQFVMALGIGALVNRAWPERRLSA